MKALLCSLGLVVALAAPRMVVAAHQQVADWPDALITPPDGDTAAHIKGAFLCTCEGMDKLKLTDPACECPDAGEDRGIIAGIVTEFTPEELKDGRASLQGAFEAMENPRLRMHVAYDRVAYGTLWGTTRSVCPGEYLQLFKNGPVSCHIRAMWSLRFKAMLALGYSADQAFNFYVHDSNATMTPKTPWTAKDLKYVGRSSITWLIPVLIVVGVLFFMVALHLRRNRREAAAAAAKERRDELSQDDQDLLDEVLEI